MTTVHKRPEAQDDLLDIWCHIGCDNPLRADRYLDLLETKLQLLAGTPGMGRPRSELAPGLRVFPVDHYLICYRPVESGIEIVRVLHGARDLEALFRADDS